MKNPRSKERTNSKLNPHMARAGIEREPHWWKVGALTTMPSLLPLGMARDGKRFLWALHLCIKKTQWYISIFFFTIFPRSLMKNAVISVENEKKQSFLL